MEDKDFEKVSFDEYLNRVGELDSVTRCQYSTQTRNNEQGRRIGWVARVAVYLGVDEEPSGLFSIEDQIFHSDQDAYQFLKKETNLFLADPNAYLTFTVTVIMPEANKESNRNIRNQDLGYLIKPFGKPGQISTRIPVGKTLWVASVMYAERINDSGQVKFTTFVVTDKEFEQSYQAKAWMKQRLTGIFVKATAPQE